MKKVFIIGLSLFLLCGCTKKETIYCLYENETDTNKFSDKVVISLENETVTDIIEYVNYENDDYAKTMCDIYQKINGKENVTCEKNTITLKNLKKDMVDDQFKKSEILRYYRERNYTCK